MSRVAPPFPPLEVSGSSGRTGLKTVCAGRVEGRAVKLARERVGQGGRASREENSLSITGRQSSVTRRGSSAAARDRRQRLGRRARQVAGGPGEQAGNCEEIFAQHGSYTEPNSEDSRIVVSQKFETEPSKYFEEKLLSAMFEKLLSELAPELQPLLDQLSERLAAEQPSWHTEAPPPRSASSLQTESADF